MKSNHEKGQALGGVRGLEGLLLRSKKDEFTDCWIWGGAVQEGTGMVWLPELASVRSVAFAALYLDGRRPTNGRKAFAKCMSKLCCNPAHCVGYTRKQITGALAAAGRFKCDPRRVATLAKYAKANRSLTDEQAEEVRTSSETGMAIAARLGVSRSVVSRIRRGETYCREEIAGASVFSFSRLAEAA